MSPEDEVTLTLTREEAARIHAALAALCELQKMMPGMPSAAKLTDAVDVLEGVLPRLRELFPMDHDASWHATHHVEKVAQDTKSYGDPFAVKIDDLVGLSPKQAAAVFATEYDEALRALLKSLTEYTDFSDADFKDLLDRTKALLVATMPVPEGLTLQESQPYVQSSDLITLGALAYEMYQRQDQIGD